MSGCVTNFKEWAFTYFSMENEVKQAYESMG